MNEPSAAAAPTSGIHPIPTFDELAADPEIAALLDFEPAVRKLKRPDGWSAGLQRELIARIAHCGSPGIAADQMDKNPTGAKHLYRAEGADSFRAAWDSAMALAEARERARRESGPARPADVPGMPNRATGPRARGGPAPYTQPLLPGQVYNERGDPEDEESVNRRGEDARDSIGNKLLACRRHYLCEIAPNPGKRAAFEILTELAIDWDKAERLEPQPDEPWTRPNMREPDMVLTAENGWLGSIVPTYGPDRIGQLREAVNRERHKRGLPIVTDWSESAERSDAEGNEARVDEGDSPIRHSRTGGNPAQEEKASSVPDGPPASRTFGLNSQEFHDAVARPGRRASVPPRD